MKNNKGHVNYVALMHKNYTTLIEQAMVNPKFKNFIYEMIGESKELNYQTYKSKVHQELLNFFRKKFGADLIPLNFWYDKVHIADRFYYLNVVFHK